MANPATNTNSSYNFPILPKEQILEFFKFLFPDLGVNENDLTNPQPERWQHFYQALLEYSTGTNQDQIFQSQFQASTKAFAYPELHEQSVPLITFTLAMSRFLIACGINDFKMADIIAPKRKKTSRIVSGVMNFIRFREERMDVYHNMKQEMTAVKEKHDILVKLNDEIQCKINAIKAKKAEQEPEIQKLQEEIGIITTGLNDLVKTQSAQQKVISDIKANIAQKTANIDQLKVGSLSAKEEGERLARQIVQSPDRMKREQEDMQNTLERLKVSKEDHINRLSDLQSQKEMRAQTETYCEHGLQLISAISSEIDKEREVMSDISAIRDRIATQQDVLRDLTAKEQQQNRLLSSKQEKVQKTGLQHQHKMAAMKENIEQYKQEKSHYEKALTEKQSQRQESERQQQDLLLELQEYENQHKATMTKMRSMYSQLLEQLDNYHVRLGTTWEKVLTKLNDNDMRNTPLQEY